MMNTESKLNIQFLMFLFFMLYHLMPSAKKYDMGFLGGLIFAGSPIKGVTLAQAAAKEARTA